MKINAFLVLMRIVWVGIVFIYLHFLIEQLSVHKFTLLLHLSNRSNIDKLEFQVKKITAYTYATINTVVLS